MRRLKIIFNSICTLVLTLVPYNAYSQYTYSDVQGIWMLSYVLPETDCPMIYGNRFIVFNKDRLMIIPTISVTCSAINEFCIYKYGFTEEKAWNDVDTLFSSGSNLAYIDNDNQYDAWSFFSLSEKEFMEFYNSIYTYVEELPGRANIVVYKQSQYDHRNYAREFLDYDICGIKTEDCQLLDSLQQPIGIAIPKDEIVVVRNNCGDLLQVEYEPASDKFVSGYLRREDLQFVEEGE